MFNRKTVFVVGAGGSFELGLPTGDQLKQVIGRRSWIQFNDMGRFSGGDTLIYEAVIHLAKKREAESRNPWWLGGRAIAEAMPQAISIDNFLHTHSEDYHIVDMG